MQTTSNLGLKRPEGNDTVNIDDLNYNADILDQEVAKRLVNSGGVPSIQAGLDADKPTAGTAGRLYVATDTQVIYRDTGTAWQKVGAVKWGDIEEKPDLALASDLAAHWADDTKHVTKDGTVQTGLNADQVDGEDASTLKANARALSSAKLVAEVSSSAPSSPVNGQIWYDSANHKFKGYANGAWV